MERSFEMRSVSIKHQHIEQLFFNKTFNYYINTIEYITSNYYVSDVAVRRGEADQERGERERGHAAPPAPGRHILVQTSRHYAPAVH